MDARKPTPVIAAAASMLLLAGCASTSGPMLPAEPQPQPVAIEPAAPGAIAAPDAGFSLFGDRRARQVGDLLTVILTERTIASKRATTSTQKDDEISFGVPTLLGRTLPEGEVGVTGEREFSGSGTSNQSNQLSGQITVTVVERYPNGNLRIRGRKQLRLNQGDEYILIEGVVRPLDITPDNTVASTQVADARISYSGRGRVHDANVQGWLSRFFNSRLWPF